MIIARDLWMEYFIIRDSWFRQLINRDSVTRGVYTPPYHALWYARGDWDGLRLFPIQDYYLRAVCQEGFDPRRGIVTDSIVIEFQS